MLEIEINDEINNALIAALIAAYCNKDNLVADGTIGPEVFKGLDELISDSDIKTQKQVNAVIDAIKDVLCWADNNALASNIIANGFVDNPVIAGIFKIKDIFANVHDTV